MLLIDIFLSLVYYGKVYINKVQEMCRNNGEVEEIRDSSRLDLRIMGQG